MFNILDLVIIAVLVLSAILAAWRGFTREVLSIGSWVGAAIVMFVLGPKAVPFMTPYIDHATLAMIAAYAAVFVLALIPLSYISFRISEGVRDSMVGPVDRLFGLVFGVARGLVVVGIGFLVFTSLVGDSRIPDWFKEARLRPLMEGSGKVIASLLPVRPVPSGTEEKTDEPVIGGSKTKPSPAKDRADDGPEPAEKAEPVAAPAPKPKASKPADTKPAPPKPPKKDTPVKEPAANTAEGYGEGERDALDQLIGSATASPAGDKPASDGRSDGR